MHVLSIGVRLPLVFLFTVQVATASAAELTIAFEPKKVTVSGATPGAIVIGFGITSEPLGYESRLERHDRTANADSSGAAIFTFDRELTLRTIWAAVDLTTGKYVVSAPPGYQPRQLFDDQRRPRLRVGRKHARSIDIDLSFAELLYVQVNGGAWGLSAGDGANLDEDAAPNGVLRTALSALRPLHTGPTPSQDFKPGDVLILIDAYAMEYLATRLTSQIR